MVTKLIYTIQSCISVEKHQDKIYNHKTLKLCVYIKRELWNIVQHLCLFFLHLGNKEPLALRGIDGR